MLDRGLLKSRAKEFLRNYFWQAFAVCLIVSILSSGFTVTYKFDKDGYEDKPFYMSNSSIDLPQKHYYTIGPGDTDAQYLLLSSTVSSNVIRIALTPFIFMIVAAIALGRMLYLIFVAHVLLVGRARYFLEGFKGPSNIGTLFSPYTRGEWVITAKKMLIMKIYLLFWYLLFFIPGVVMSYAYRMVPYILSEDPTLPIEEAINKSKSMTNGIKMDMFVLDLSFIGWYLLTVFTCGIGVPFVHTYYQTTLAKLYESLTPEDIDPALLPA